MDRAEIRRLLEAVQSGSRSIDDAVAVLAGFPAEDLGFASVDHGRALRCGFPEVVLCTNKSADEVVAIADRVLERSARLLLTRVNPDLMAALAARHPGGRAHAAARIFHVDRDPAPPRGLVAVLSAGTADVPVAEEAAVTAGALGSRVERAYDVGVAGLHRLLAHRDLLGAARAIVVVAGMEGALASVVGGLVDAPVIAVPTSIGYGASFQGLAALLAMLNACAAGVTVVNIDNGFGAGYAAALVNRLAAAEGFPERA
jgi:NCAIR mutase (PurE)-related protein